MCLADKFSAKVAFVMLLLFSSRLFATTEIHISDARGRQTFIETPTRVVVLNWDLLEQVIALDIIPLAAPNLSGYQQWVVNPPVPDEIEDIGTRSEPNLEKIATLAPDVIIVASEQQSLIPILESIAPVVYLPNFSKQDDAAKVAIKNFKTLATLFGKERVAKHKLEQIDARFNELNAQLSAVFPELPDVVLMRFASQNSAFFYTENSTAQYVISRLGLHNPLPFSPQSWSTVQRRISILQHLDSSYLLYMLPFPEEKKLKDAPLWQAMPFVQKGHVHSVEPVWSYGGALSLQYMAEAITASLLEVAVKQ